MRHGRGNILYVDFTPHAHDTELRARERRMTVMGSVTLLVLVVAALSFGLYLVLG